MIEMEKPSIECVDLSEDGRYGKFVVSPLERGYVHPLAIRCAEYCFHHYPVRQQLQ